ncbi:MAG: S41 family peptidase [Pyrinomonadaceae bacterium]
MGICKCFRTTRGKFRYVLATLALLLMQAALLPSYSQSRPTGVDIDRGHEMLRQIKDDLKKNYYDPTYHGMDVEARFKAADEKIKQAASLSQIFGIIAQVLLDLDDSHTFFLPPQRSARAEYGWQAQVIGDKAYVVAVRPGSDAEAKGLRPGDEIVSVDGVHLSRKNLWIFGYLYYALRPQPAMQLAVVKPDGKQEQIDVLTKIEEGRRRLDLTGRGAGADFHTLVLESEADRRLHRHRWVESGEELFVWKMPDFDLSKQGVDDMVSKFRKRKMLILDLRGNGGGYVDALTQLLGYFFDHDVKVGDPKGRKETKPVIAKSQGNDIFPGKLIVLIDSGSASAAELFARVVQLEKRGTVIGDNSAGSVMRSIQYERKLGLDTIILWGVSITNADLRMSDGKSLEHVGVVPDETRLPTAADLAAKCDPVLAYAVSLMGGNLSPEKAGALFPIEWKK